jgi:hypothetical protein
VFTTEARSRDDPQRLKPLSFTPCVGAPEAAPFRNIGVRMEIVSEGLGFSPAVGQENGSGFSRCGGVPANFVEVIQADAVTWALSGSFDSPSPRFARFGLRSG